jgi:hypothetical protein
MRCTIGIALECDRWNGNDWSGSKSLLELVVLRFALGEPETPTVVVNDDADMIGLSNDVAVRLNVSSSKFHLGDASCQMSFANSRLYFS